MAQADTLMIASRPSWMVGSGTVSQRMSSLPCQVSARMGGVLGVVIQGEPSRPGRDAGAAGEHRVTGLSGAWPRPAVRMRD